MTRLKETRAMRTVESDLRQTFRGPVHVPGDDAYDRERATWSGRLDQRPVVVAEAASPADVRAALVAAREHGLPFAVQSTGHGTQVACDGGVLLKTGRLGGVLVDPERRVARVGAGVTWGEVVATTAPLGLLPTAGSTPSVGVTGFTLGGGVGWLSRRFGLAADNLVAAEVVTTDGRMLRVDERRHPDLFWALRGGGGNFAIVTALDVRLHPVADVVAGELTFERERAAEILTAYRDGAGDRPDALSVNVAVQRDAVVVRAMYSGPAADALVSLAPLLRAGGAPVRDTLRRCAFADAPLGGTAPQHFELLDDVPVDAILAAAEEADGVELRHWGGAIAAAPDPGPAGHRQTAYSVTIAGPDAALDPLRPHVTGGTFLNFLHDQSRTADAYTATDLRDLQALKRAWDPDNVLGHTHNIAPHAAASRAAA